VGPKIDFYRLGDVSLHQQRWQFANLLACCCFAGTAAVLVKLPGFEAAGLIGRVWRWKPNKLPRKVPKIAERKIHPQNRKALVLFLPFVKARF